MVVVIKRVRGEREGGAGVIGRGGGDRQRERELSNSVQKPPGGNTLNFSCRVVTHHSQHDVNSITSSPNYLAQMWLLTNNPQMFHDLNGGVRLI